MMDSISIKAAFQLLVEGKDQVNFMQAFAKHHGLAKDELQICDFGGVGDLRGFLSAFVKAPQFSETVTRLGIVRDAEKSASAAFQSVKSSLMSVGLDVPDVVETMTNGMPAVSIMILPGNEMPGMLESLLCETIHGTVQDRCIDEFFACVGNEIPENRRPKAKAHAWITTQERPYVSVGVAAQRGFWDLDHAALVPLRRFLCSLTTDD